MFYDMSGGRWENYNLHEKDQAFHRMNVGSNLRQSQRRHEDTAEHRLEANIVED